MKRLAALIASIAMLAAPAWAGMRTVTLAVPGMTCAACPITVKKALSRVEGVREVEVSYARREAVVRFDDTLTTAAALARASANAGYPATVKD